MELTDRQRNYRDSVREFSDQEIAPLAKQIDEIEEYPRHLFEKLSDFGLFGIQAPKEYGGQGLDTVSYAIAVEEVSRVCGSTGIMVAAHNSLGLMPFILFGNDDQKQEYIPILANGKEGLGSFGLTEPGAGSDAGATKTTAVQDGDHWVVNGNKCFITNAGLCRVLVTTAKTEKIPGSRGITSFIVDRGTPGFIVGKKEDKMGLRGSDTRELAFESMRLPVEKVLGKEGDGFKQFMIILDGGRISIAAMALGLAQGAFDYASHHVKTTSYLGKPKTDYQSYQWKIADMYTRIQAARHLVLHAARLEDAHQKIVLESAMAKLYASEIATESIRAAMQIVGQRGYLEETPLERMYRDVRLCEVGEGTSEIQRIVISRNLFKS